MAVEIERLNEETKQLRAAVLMYREVARRSQREGSVLHAESFICS
jgi:hypothetical protein